mgnify:CR=1 FL=1
MVVDSVEVVVCWRVDKEVERVEEVMVEVVEDEVVDVVVVDVEVGETCWGGDAFQIE